MMVMMLIMISDGSNILRDITGTTPNYPTGNGDDNMVPGQARENPVKRIHSLLAVCDPVDYQQ